MNIYQRIVLIVGAIVFVAVMITTPRYVAIGNTGDRIQYALIQEMIAKHERGECAATESFVLSYSYDFTTVVLRGFTVLGAVGLLYFAVGKAKKVM